MTDERWTIERVEKEPTIEAIAESIRFDAAGRNQEIVDFVKLLESIKGPYTILLEAPWGDGKTFFVKSVEFVLKARNPNLLDQTELRKSDWSYIDRRLGERTRETSFLPFYFSAWQNDFIDDSLIALFASMAANLQETKLTIDRDKTDIITSVLDEALKCLGALIKTKVPTAEIPSVETANIAEAVRGKNLVEAYNERRKVRDRVDQLANKSHKGLADKLVIFIDELDRCRPDFAINLLENIKALFQSENIIVVISVDSVQLAHALAGVYGPSFDSSRFLEKFFDMRLELGQSDPYRVVRGRSLPKTGELFDMLVSEMLAGSKLTIRDFMRLERRLSEAQQYSKSEGDGSVATKVARCALLPVLVFLEREDQGLFRRVTRGIDYSALYERGSVYEAFVVTIREALASRGGRHDAATDERCESYVHDLCVVLYSPNGDEVEEARRRIHVTSDFDPKIYKDLQFP